MTAKLAAVIANKFMNHEQRAARMDFVRVRNWALGGSVRVIDYPDDYAAVFIDDMARIHVEEGGKPLTMLDRGEPTPGFKIAVD